MSDSTLEYYARNFKEFGESTFNVDFSSTQERFLRHLPPKAAILDFGCGSGRDTSYFLQKGFSVTSTDGSPEMCRLASANTGHEVKHLLFQELDAESAFDGILITHGTDTCAFFAQLASRVLASLGIPFVITGSVKAPDIDPDEASGNLAHAVVCLEKGGSGAVFRDRDGNPALYRAHLIMSPDINGIYSEYEDGVLPDAGDCKDFLTEEKLPEMLVIPAVPGAVIPSEGFDRVLICCNHSGTASTDLEPLVRKWTSEGIKCFMAPVPLSGGVYESRKILREAGAVELPGMPLEGAWCEVMIR